MNAALDLSDLSALAALLESDSASAPVSVPRLSAALGTGRLSSNITGLYALTFDGFVALIEATPLHVGRLPLAEYQRLKESKDPIEKKRAADDKDGPWYSLARYSEPKRKAKNVERVYGFGGDLDAKGLTLEDIAEKLTGLVYAAHTTHSHSTECPRSRVVIPYTCPVSPSEHKRLFEYFNSSAMFDGALDTAASDESRLWYFRSACADTTHLARMVVQREGAYFDPGTVLASMPPAPPSSHEPSPGWTDVPVWPCVPGTDAELIARARARDPQLDDLLRADHSKIETRYLNKAGDFDHSIADYALACKALEVFGGNMERTAEFLLNDPCVELRRPGHWGEGEKGNMRRHTIPNAFKALAANATTDPRKLGLGQGPKPAGMSATPIVSAAPAPPATPAVDPRATIYLVAGKFEEYVEQCEELISDAVYERGGGLVRIGHAVEISKGVMNPKTEKVEYIDAAGIARDAEQVVFVQATPAWLRRELMRRAMFWRFDARGGKWARKDCPKGVAEDIAQQGDWATFRSLNAISMVPVLRDDMSVWDTPGYDPATRIYYQPTLVMPPALPNPTQVDAHAALARLLRPFREFPYASKAARSVFAAHVLTMVLRASFPTSPVFLYTATMSGTGKTLLAQMAQLTATGTVPPLSPYTTGEELRKVLFAALLAGDSGIIFDNLEQGAAVKGKELCAFATSLNYSDRVLGASKRATVPNLCTVVLTGNNITPAGDLPRRSLVCRLVIDSETSGGRTFEIADLMGHVQAHRAELIADAMTIVRAYKLAGRPYVGLLPLPSFEKWSSLIRDALVWLGMADPASTQVTEGDDGVMPLRAAFEAIAAATKAQEFTAAQLAPLVIPVAATVFGGTQATGSTLFDALVAAGCKEPTDSGALGYWLRAHKDSVAGEWKLMKGALRHSAVTWRLRPLAEVRKERAAAEGAESDG
jgi:putative DNA primase/helicase